MLTYEISLFIAIILFFAAELIHANSFLLCVFHFRLFYTNFKSIFNKNSHEEKCYHYNSHRRYLLIMKCGGCEYRTKSN